MPKIPAALLTEPSRWPNLDTMQGKIQMVNDAKWLNLQKRIVMFQEKTGLMRLGVYNEETDKVSQERNSFY